jgi:UDP-3-O-[3-hydroxymyristoyl] N-acetylglucosamine deacetylase
MSERATELTDTYAAEATASNAMGAGEGLDARQMTIATPALCAGIGLHSGVRARLTLLPAPIGTGIVFIRTDVHDRDNRILARGDYVNETMLGTTLTNKAGVSVATVEHLLAALAGFGLDNLIIEIDGPEVPIMDGSSAMYARLLMNAGVARQAGPRRQIRILEPIEVRQGDKFARLVPGEGFTLDVGIAFDHAAIGTQRAHLNLTPDTFVRELAFARTFGFSEDVEKLKSMGLARGGSLENAIVLEGGRVLNPEGLRAEDEFVRHKMLDAIGDLYLLGASVIGRFEAEQPGHAINNALVRAVLNCPSAWCWDVQADDRSGFAAAGL